MTPKPNPAGLHPDITATAEQIIGLYQNQRESIARKSTSAVEELLHRAEDLRNHETFSIRSAAEINRAAAVMVLAERGRA